MGLNRSVNACTCWHRCGLPVRALRLALPSAKPVSPKTVPPVPVLPLGGGGGGRFFLCKRLSWLRRRPRKARSTQAPPPRWSSPCGPPNRAIRVSGCGCIKRVSRPFALLTEPQNPNCSGGQAFTRLAVMDLRHRPPAGSRRTDIAQVVSACPSSSQSWQIPAKTNARPDGRGYHGRPGCRSRPVHS